MKVDWSKRVILITGASSGIGGALAVELGRRGASVGLFARRAEELMKVAEEVERVGGKALVLRGDVRQAPEIEAAARRLRELWGRIDLLVANSGIGVITPASELRADAVANVISGTPSSRQQVARCATARAPGRDLVAISASRLTRSRVGGLQRE